VKTITIMCKLYECDQIYKTPRKVVNAEGPWIYSTLSIDGGGSPLHYWTPSYAVMEDFWDQIDLDAYASFHGVSAVHSLRLKDEDADAFIAKIERNSIDRSPKEPVNR
jgi:hypothetical protein